MTLMKKKMRTAVSAIMSGRTAWLAFLATEVFTSSPPQTTKTQVAPSVMKLMGG